MQSVPKFWQTPHVHLQTKWQQFVGQELWTADLCAFSPGRRAVWRLLQLGYIVGRGFWFDHQCLLRASALTYTTLLALVPMLAFMFSFLKGVGIQNLLEPILLDKLSVGSEEAVRRIIDYVNNVEAKTLGVIGLISLFGSTLLQLGTIEHTLNEIWGIHTGRSLLRKLTDYCSMTIIAPVVLLLATTINATVQSQTLVATLLETRLIGDALLLLFTLLSYVALWGVFTFFYAFMPNTQVKMIPASVGGVLAGLLWQLAQWAYIEFQVGVTRYHAIYGAFAQLPVLMVWVYISWVIVLLGAEVSYACQHVTSYSAERHTAQASFFATEWLASALYFSLVRAYSDGLGSWSAPDFAQQHRLPLSVLRPIVQQLCHAKLLVEDATAPEHYVPGRDPATVTPWHVLYAIRHNKDSAVESTLGQVDDRATTLLTGIEEAIHQAAGARSIAQWLDEQKSG